MDTNAQQTGLIDSFGRTINYIRISITDRCDFRCVYCMTEDMTFLPKSKILTLEEIETLCGIFVELGIRKIRLTGGEPLVRNNVTKLIEGIGQLEELEELTITTNGSQLVKYADEIKKAILKFFNETNINEMIENINQIKKHYSWSIFTKKLLALTSFKKNDILT